MVLDQVRRHRVVGDRFFVQLGHEAVAHRAVPGGAGALAQGSGEGCGHRRVLLVGRRTWLRLSQPGVTGARSEEHTSELQSRGHLVCRLLLEKKKIRDMQYSTRLSYSIT